MLHITIVKTKLRFRSFGSPYGASALATSGPVKQIARIQTSSESTTTSAMEGLFARTGKTRSHQVVCIVGLRLPEVPLDARASEHDAGAAVVEGVLRGQDADVRRSLSPQAVVSHLKKFLKLLIC